MTENADGILSGRRVVIFGCGYVGSEFARQAVSRGLRVTALTRNEAKAAALRADGVDVHIADLAGDAWHGRIEGSFDFALNCVSSGGGGIESYRRSYRAGMASVLAWARSAGGVGTFVYTSSTSVYPQGDGAVVDESSATDNLNERPRILLEAENLLATAPPTAVRRWFGLRLAGIYGPGRSHLLDQVRSGEIAGRAGHRLNLAHRDDIVSAVWAGFGAPSGIANEVLNVADDAPTPKGEVAAWLATRLQLPPPRFTGEPLGGRRAITPDRLIANGKIKRALGWRPQFPTFREGYEKILSHWP